MAVRSSSTRMDTFYKENTQSSVYIYHTATHAFMQAECIISLDLPMSILVTVGLWWWKPLGGPVSLGTLASC